MDCVCLYNSLPGICEMLVSSRPAKSFSFRYSFLSEVWFSFFRSFIFNILSKKLINVYTIFRPGIGFFDSDGKLRMILSIMEKAPGLVFYGSNEEQRMTIVVVGDSPSIVCCLNLK